MAPAKFLATEDSVLAAWAEGRLLEIIFSYANLKNDELSEVCVRLHNEHELNLLELVQSDEFKSINTQKFFAGQNFYCDTIPLLSASVYEMAACVRTLVAAAGADMAAYFPREAFRKWCEADLSRSREIIDSAAALQDCFVDFLTPALVAGHYSTDARSFVSSHSGERRLSGIFSLCRMKHADAESAAETISVLLKVVASEGDDVLHANALSTVFAIDSNYSQANNADFLSVVERVCQNAGPAVCDVCASVLLEHHKRLSSEQFTLLLSALMSLNSQHGRTLQTLDVALGQLLATPNAKRSIEFLKAYLTANKDALEFSKFSSFQHSLKEHSAYLQDAFLDWMLTGENAICEGIAELFRDTADQAYSFDLSVEHLTPDQQIFVCRKVLGYLITQPTVVASFFVCVLRQCNDSVSEHICGLLFDPLLRNYGGKAKSYLAGIKSDDPSYPRLQAPLLKLEHYIENIKSVGTVKELHASEEKRHSVHLKDFDEMQRTHKDAMAASPLLNLVHRSVVLHGRRTLSYVRGPSDELKPMEMELHSHSFEIEMPRQHVLDPVGLDYAIRVLRLGRLKP